MDNSMDDVWGSDSDIEIRKDDEEQLRSYDLRKLREIHAKRGYLDGIVSSKETNLQQGFNAGFPTGAQLGFQVGKIIGVLQGLKYKYGDEDEELKRDYELAKRELLISALLSKSIFTESFDLPNGHAAVDKWTDIVDKYSNKYNVIKN
ncbi:hypothetical protein KAFR_0A08110 [Kazachstania africana CBS 2517]|uniref:Protein YAE1 n=1 Tax=Kazachstania africana (strain ATCC 22294 / BCRC 22015 / CBS 2517 / CECT 1963 / NBRC 1671 / NRRL Y-8276) TaxID=1071382 RepID=H2APE5_KAZAF|nr:hypothetical protein KAFR_0A08110 [Kazachstania africana CBS 2517]CCF56245.1 hypothetical protein KAFR_0A08110 [Kazachstania africana CBS 2517]